VTITRAGVLGANSPLRSPISTCSSVSTTCTRTRPATPCYGAWP
jgi:hypothetical protein